MTVHHDPLDEPGQPLEQPRAVLLGWNEPLPVYEDMVIDGLSDDEEALFLAAITEA